jgi:exodeoxyribonuclease VII large subunit
MESLSAGLRSYPGYCINHNQPRRGCIPSPVQLDFDLSPRKPCDEPPPSPDEERHDRLLTVSELTRRVRVLLEERIGPVWVEGEISNHRRQASGHHYFTLKDDASNLSCVLFARAAAALGGLRIGDGAHVEVFGTLGVYEPRGQYQLIVKTVRLRGEGALQAKFEALKKALEAEGLFAPGRKRPLPRFPTKVGLVTSPTGAALRDFLDVLHRRHPGIAVIVNPVRVQGRGAAAEIARAVREFSDAPSGGIPAVDVVVVTRGGGSIEDLWEFNEEEVARAVAASRMPVVSAVGHEIDFTICDFAADVRAPTPSAAAEILSADAAEVAGRLGRERVRMVRACRAVMELSLARMRAVAAPRLLREPMRAVDRCRQSLDRGLEDLARTVNQSMEGNRNVLSTASARLDPKNLLPSIGHLRARADSVLSRLAAAQRDGRASVAARLRETAAKLATLDPSATLARGFTITCDPDGKPITSVAAARAAGVLRTRFADGQISSKVQKS